MAGRVGTVQSTSTKTTIGHGFVITDAEGKLALTLVYDTEEKAEAARKLVEQALTSAIDAAKL